MQNITEYHCPSLKSAFELEKSYAKKSYFGHDWIFLAMFGGKVTSVVSSRYCSFHVTKYHVKASRLVLSSERFVSIC